MKEEDCKVRKSYFYAVVGAGLLLVGCNSDPIMGNHKYQPIPVDDPANTVQAEINQPAAPIATKPVKTAIQKFPPMTDAMPSGGVDSVPGKKVKNTRKSNSNAVAANGGTYVIQRGDTPERIARKHKVKLSALMQANNLDEAKARRLQIGQKLIIPGKGAVVAPVANKKNGKVSVAPSAAPALENGKYKVQRGDSPERIARRFKVKLKDLLAANNLDEAKARRLQIGQLLVIPGSDANVKPAVSKPVVDKPAVVEPKNEVENAPVSDSDVKPEPEKTGTDSTPETDNQGGEDTYNTWEAPEDTTYAAVAAKFGIAEEKLREINAATSTATIKKGDWLLIPKK
jgi:LysM repeat protein